jgi:hypothetical protein
MKLKTKKTRDETWRSMGLEQVENSQLHVQGRINMLSLIFRCCGQTKRNQGKQFM